MHFIFAAYVYGLQRNLNKLYSSDATPEMEMPTAFIKRAPVRRFFLAILSGTLGFDAYLYYTADTAPFEFVLSSLAVSGSFIVILCIEYIMCCRTLSEKVKKQFLYDRARM